MPYHLKINGFEVAMDTADELSAIVGQFSPASSQPPGPRALPPMTVAARAAPAANDGAPRKTRPHAKFGKLPEYLQTMREFWPTLPPKMLETVQARAAGEDNDTIAKKTNRTSASVSVMVNLARRRLEACRDAALPATALRETPEDDDGDGDEGEGDGEGEDPEPDLEPDCEPDFEFPPGEIEKEEVEMVLDVDVDVGPAKKTLRRELELARRRHVDDVLGPAPKDDTWTPGNTLQKYMQALRAYPLLSAEEERDLTAEYARTQDPAIAKKLVQANLRFVIKMALAYRSERAKLIDLIQEGNLGLMKAVRKFQPSRGFRLTTYAKHWINAYMKLFIMNNKRLIKVGTTQGQRTLFWKLNSTKNRLERENGGLEATAEDIAKELKIKTSDVASMMSRLAAEKGLERREEDGSSREWIADSKERPDESFEANEQIENVQRAANALRPTLSERMLYILDNRLLAEEPVTLVHIADRYSVSRERVRQLEARLMAKIRDKLGGNLRAVA